MIEIGVPYIIKLDNKSRLYSDIKINNHVKKIYYEVDSIYERYLTDEVVDAFVVALIHYAMETKQNIYSAAPISEQLYYQLKYNFIPILAKKIYNDIIELNINIHSDQISKGQAVGTGVSAGVDSLYTIQANSNLDSEKFNITDLVFLDVGSHGKGPDAKKLYELRLNNIKKLVYSLDLNLIEISSNLYDQLNIDFVNAHTFNSVSAILSLQKFFKVYYFSSGVRLEDFQITENIDSAHYDILSLIYLSTNNTIFYSSGLETSRLDKTESISNYSASYDYLDVCVSFEPNRDYINCGLCEKCIRTQMSLYSINKLSLYSKVFDLKLFETMLDEHMGYMLSNPYDIFYPEIINKVKENNVKIPAKSYLYLSKIKIRNFLVKSKIIHKIGQKIKHQYKSKYES